jgi:hypothetical protein
MRQFMMTVTALAVFGAMVVTAQAENQNPSSPTASGPVKKRTVLHKASFAECEKKALDVGLVPGDETKGLSPGGIRMVPRRSTAATCSITTARTLRDPPSVTVEPKSRQLTDLG